jgi:spore germination cell wall hydrolase CwlJ-like protein
MLTPAAICLAMAVYFEARSEPEEGQRQVVHVIMNRVHHSGWPNDICSVVKQPYAFSFFWDGKPETPNNMDAWRVSNRVVKEAMENNQENLGATHYHTTDISPSWSRSPAMKELGTIGNHIFYYEER